MRRTLLILTAAAGALFLAADGASAQSSTIAQLQGSYTPVGRLPAGTYGVTNMAMPATFIVDLRARNPSGQLLVQQGGAETKHDVMFVNTSSWTGKDRVDQFSFWFDQGNDVLVTCTVVRREANRFSGLCRDASDREGWIQIMGRVGETIGPGVWFGPGQG
jgi:hypothetical protein